jgi:hypothetical protein
MRNILVAALALAPALVYAQAPSPAQPRGAQAPMLESKLVSPQPVEGAASPNALHSVSILVGPKLIKWSNIQVDESALTAYPNHHDRSLVLSMNVSAAGVPTDVKVVNSDDPLLNNSVVSAVSSYRFTPASLNSKPTSVPLMLKVKVRDQE